jgi:DNA-directed RNA polymerase subunit E'/Rpb7
MSTKNIEKKSSLIKKKNSTPNKNNIEEEKNNIEEEKNNIEEKNINNTTLDVKNNIDENKNISDTTNIHDKTTSNDTNNQFNKLISSNIHNPFIDTTLVCPIMLLPNQMDNKMYLHLKSNLKNKLESKCYKNYGYVNKIYSIEEISDGIIEAEDPSCSAKIIVKFTCNLCLPIVGKEIICKIDRMNKTLMSAINGPIKTIITTDKINKENFFPDMNRNIRIKGNSQVLVPEMFVRILILSKSFGDYDKNILIIGYLQDIATKEQVEQYYKINNDNNEINNIINEELF